MLDLRKYYYEQERRRRAAALGGIGFSPLDLSPHIWLDPSDLTTLFQDSGGTTPVAANDDPVGKVNDKSGNANHVAQSTAGARPLYKTGSGLPYIQFDGTDDYLEGTAISNMLTASTFDLLVAGIMPTADTAGGAAWYDADIIWSPANNVFIGLAVTNGTPPKVRVGNFDGSHDLADDDYVLGDAFVIHMRHTGGVLSLTQNARTTVTVASGDTQNIAGLLRLARTDDSRTVFAALRLYGFFCRKTTLTAGELAQMKTYMGQKVGLSL